MIRHILFWKLQEEYREGEKRREAEARLAASVETLAPIPGLHNAKPLRLPAAGRRTDRNDRRRKAECVAGKPSAAFINEPTNLSNLTRP